MYFVFKSISNIDYISAINLENKEHRTGDIILDRTELLTKSYIADPVVNFIGYINWSIYSLFYTEEQVLNLIKKGL